MLNHRHIVQGFSRVNKEIKENVKDYNNFLLQNIYTGRRLIDFVLKEINTCHIVCKFLFFIISKTVFCLKGTNQ